MEHLEVAVVRLATTTASTTATAGGAHGCAAACLLEAADRQPLFVGRLHRPEGPRSDRQPLC
jgi:hypothetical protein